MTGTDRHRRRHQALSVGRPRWPAIDLRIEAGEYCVLLGPSGCGKTTLLNILGGFADPTAGAVRIGGRDMVGVAAPRSARPRRCFRTTRCSRT